MDIPSKYDRWIEILIVSLLFVAALAVRIYRLDEIPTGLFNDEAENGLDAAQILQGHYSVFFERNTGREPLFIYFQALVASVVGLSPFSLRLTAAIVGALSVPAAYWMVKSMFSDCAPNVRLWATGAALLMTFGYWHFSLSRIGFRAISLPLFIALTYGFLGRAWRRLDNNGPLPLPDLILDWGLVGGGLYTYTAARLLPVAVGLALLMWLIREWPELQQRRRTLVAVAVIVATSLVVFLPLGAYFLRHPEMFWGRAASVSAFGEDFEQKTNPLLGLLRSTWDAVMMFVFIPDPNLRHNPALRPAFEPLMTVFLVIGMAIAAVRALRIRPALPYASLLILVFVMALPAVLTVKNTPHYLRAVGMMPVVYVLTALGLIVTGRLFATRSRIIAVWMLPFLVFSGARSAYDYFHAWQDTGQFRLAFLSDYTRLAETLGTHSLPTDAAWILPLSPNFNHLEATFATIEFLYPHPDQFFGIVVDERVVLGRFADALLRREQAYLIKTQEMDEHFQDASRFPGDPKKMLPFLLTKYGRLVGSLEADKFGISVAVYEVLPQAANGEIEFSIVEDDTPIGSVFSDRVALISGDFGRVEDGSDLGRRVSPAGQPLWAALTWEALTRIDIDLKTHLVLRDSAGRAVGDVDDLLVGDRYPLRRTWDQGETTRSYHVLTTPPALAPGSYDLFVGVYEDKTLRNYPVLDSGGSVTGIEALLGAVTITRNLSTESVMPPITIDDGQFSPDVQLVGLEPLPSSVRPGSKILATLYWQATQQPAHDYVVRLALESADFGVLAESAGEPADGQYPTSAWIAGETVRDVHELTVPPDAPSGTYNLMLALMQDGNIVAKRSVAQVQAEGLVRHLSMPHTSVTLDGYFEPYLRLAGADAAPPLHGVPDGVLELDLVWEVLNRPEGNLVRFVHLLNAEGQLVAQQDIVPCNSECPAASWISGEYLLDPVRLELPKDLAPGYYGLAVGWYDSETYQRMKVDGPDDEQADILMLVSLPVQIRLE